MRRCALAACALALPFLLRPVAGAAAPAELGIRDAFDWEGASALSISFRDQDTVLVARWSSPEGEAANLPSAGLSLPFIVAGPVLGHGLFRLASDPLACTAASGVFREQTAIVLDSSLRSSWHGLAVTPFRGGAVFAREHGHGRDCGACARVPLGAGAGAEGFLLFSRLPVNNSGEDWFLTRSPFPGGDITHVGGRLYVESPRFDFSVDAIASSPAWAAPGSTAGVWVRGKSSDAEGSLLVSVASSDYRGVDGAGLTDSSVISAAIQLGSDEKRGTIRAGCTRIIGTPEFAPHPEIPQRTVLKLDVSRDFNTAPRTSLSVLARVDKEIVRDSTAECPTKSRAGGEIRLSSPGLFVRAGAGLSDRDGADLLAGVALGSGLRAQADAEIAGLGASVRGSACLGMSREQGTSTTSIRLGVEDYPFMTRTPPAPSQFLRLSLLTSIRIVP